MSDRAFMSAPDVVLSDVSGLSPAMQAKIRSLHVSVFEQAFWERMDALLAAPRPSVYPSQRKPSGAPFRMGP